MEVDKEQAAKSKDIDSQIRKGGKEWDSELKILLLGIGESGKSTIAKQMRILYLNGFPEAERKHFIPIVHANILSSTKILALATRHLGIDGDMPEEMNELAEEFREIEAYRVKLDKGLVAKIHRLWQDPVIQVAYGRSSEYFLPGCCAHFFASMDRVVADDYIPSLEDILRCRVKTTAVIETVFSYEETSFRMVDVGGQRSERRKWIHCFQDVTALLYIVAISEYDQKLMEDSKVNRMTETMELFEELINSVWFRNVAIICFLNKTDLFREKIKVKPLKDHFPDYDGGADYDRGVFFISEKFKALNRVTGRTVFGHQTCATNTENIRYVFSAVKDTLLQRMVEDFI